jgi:hypothetical protein
MARVSPPDIVAMLRRHLIAVAVACLAVLGLGYHFAHMNPGYTDVGTIGFLAPHDPLTGFANSRGTQAIKVATAEYMMGSAASQQVRAAGGTANYDVELVNSYNEEFPDYSQPYATVTTNSPDPTAALNTYNAVVSVLIKDLAQRQAQQGARPKVQITALPVNTTGPTIQSGSNKRVYAATAALMVIAAFMTASVLDRRKRPRARPAVKSRRRARGGDVVAG